MANEIDVKDVGDVSSLADTDKIQTISGNLGKNIPAKTFYSLLVNKIPEASLTANGIMSSADKAQQNRANWFQAYSYTNGVLVETNVPSSSNVMFLVEFTVNSYTEGRPKRFLIQGYNFNTEGKILSASGSLICGTPIPVSCFIYNGYLCFWLKQSMNFQTILVKGDLNYNQYYITKLSNVEKPTNVTRLVEVTPI